MSLMLLRTLALRSSRTFSTTASKNAVHKVEMPQKPLRILKDRLSSMKLLQDRNKVSMRLDENVLVVEGDEKAIEEVTPKLAALQTAEHEKDFIAALSGLLGSEPVKVPLWPKRAGPYPPYHPDSSWILRGLSDGTMHIWADTASNAKDTAEMLQKWIPVVRDYKEHKNFRAELETHPTFRWVDRHAYSALPLKEVLVDKFQEWVKIWAVTEEAAKEAAEFFQKPFRPVDAVDVEMTISLNPELEHGKNDSESFERVKIFDTIGKSLAPSNDESYSLVEGTPTMIKVATYWPPQRIVDAFKKKLQKSLKEDEKGRVFIDLVSTNPESARRAIDMIKAEFSADVLSIATGEVASSNGVKSTLVFLIGTTNGPIQASKLFFDNTPNLVKLRLKAFKDIHDDVSQAFMNRIGKNVLNWGDNARSLRHWGLDWFSAVDETGIGQAQMQQDLDSIAVAVMDEFKRTGYQDGVALWHMSNGKFMLAAKDQQTLDAYMANLKSSPASSSSSAAEEEPKGKKSPSSSAAGKSGEEHTLTTPAGIKSTKITPPPSKAEAKPAKVTRLTVPAPSSSSRGEGSEKPAKVTRISTDAGGADVSSLNDAKVKVTRIVAPSFSDESGQVTEEGAMGDMGHNRRGKKITPKGFDIVRTLEVPANMTGKVIGRHGMVMRGIETRTKTVIELEDAAKGKKATVTISGATDAHVDLAMGEIQTILEDAEEKDKIDHEGGTALRKSRVARRRRSAGEESDRAGEREEEQEITKHKLFSPGLRANIYESYKNDPERWTEEELCRHFRVTPEHLHAIIVVMKKREAFFETNKDDEQLLSRSLEEAMIAKCGETSDTSSLEERPLLKSHFRFVNPSSPAATPRLFSSDEEEFEVRRKEYENKIAPILAKKLPKLDTFKEEKKGGGFSITLEDTRKIIAAKE